MPTNDFQLYAQGGGANVVSQASYAADPLVGTGRGSGILPSNFYNKSLRQGSVGSYLIAQLIVDILGVDALDNASAATLLANFKLAISKTSTQPTVQRFTSGVGTYTRTSANVRRIWVRMIGGGGGGGAVITNDGAAGTTTALDFVASAGGGAAGLKGTSIGGAGGAGGTGGTDVAGTTIIRASGGDGGSGTINGGATFNAQGGMGGSGVFGGAGRNGNSSTGQPGKANTGGGGGGASANSGSVNSAGGGGSGEYVELYLNNPSASYGYTIGAGGAGGAAGTVAGGAGAAGVVIIVEFYN